MSQALDEETTVIRPDPIRARRVRRRRDRLARSADHRERHQRVHRTSPAPQRGGAHRPRERLGPDLGRRLEGRSQQPRRAGTGALRLAPGTRGPDPTARPGRARGHLGAREPAPALGKRTHTPSRICMARPPGRRADGMGPGARPLLRSRLHQGELDSTASSRRGQRRMRTRTCPCSYRTASTFCERWPTSQGDSTTATATTRETPGGSYASCSSSMNRRAAEADYGTTPPGRRAAKTAAT